MERCVSGVVGVFAMVVVAGCAGGGVAAPADSPVTIESSDRYLTVRNVAGMALTNVMIGIKPASVQPEYQVLVRRLEGGAERQFPLAEFRGNDGTPLTLRVVTVRHVHITATDINGREYDVELPWD